VSISLLTRAQASRRFASTTAKVWVDKNTKLCVQGFTGKQGTFHAEGAIAYGTQVVGGTNPKKAGTDVDGIPIFASVAEAVSEAGANASCIFIPAPGVRAAVMEAAEGGIEFIVCITEGIPAQDEARTYNTLVRDFPKVRLLGPNCPGIISPGKCNIGITAGEIAELPSAKGPNVGIVSRSGTLTYQALYELKQRGIGVSTCVGIGGDPVPGTSFIDCLREFQADPETHAIIMIGEIGGSAEEEAAEFIKANVTKPMSAYIAGVTAPAGKKMGHAGAIVSGGKGTAQGKMDALRAAGVKVGQNPTEAGSLMAEIVAGLK
jgi:succinyl-CoA synthetase alpha subunit